MFFSEGIERCLSYNQTFLVALGGLHSIELKDGSAIIMLFLKESMDVSAIIVLFCGSGGLHSK